MVSYFCAGLYSHVRQGNEDKICWIPCKRKKFDVKSCYHVLSMHVSFSFPRKSI